MMRARILLLEDDARIRAAMRMALEYEGHRVHEVASGEEALRDFADEPFDIALVDLMLPGMDGFEVCRTLRQTSDIPIIMVTARTDSHDVVAGLEAGADDYISKPFVAKELSARIRALLRRARGQAAPRPRSAFGDIEVLPDEGVVRRSGQELHLTKTEFRLLCELAANPGKVLSREELLASVWDYDYFCDGRLVDVQVRRLRTKIEPDPADPRHILTVRGLGYKLVP
jgi:DNA-binding response OmpR family regulator